MKEHLNRELNISITPRTIIMAIFILAVVFALWQIKSTILVMMIAVVIASFIDSGVLLLKKIHIPRSVAVIFWYFIGFGIIAGALYIFVPVFLDELVDIVRLLPDDSPVAGVFDIFGNGSLKDTLSQVSRDTSGGPFAFIGEIRDQFSAANILQGLSKVFGGIFNFVLVIVVSFYLSMIKDGVSQFLRVIVPPKHEDYVIDVWHRSKIKIGGWFRGQLLLAVIQGTSTYVGLLVIGVPYALLLGLATIIFSLIPYGVILASVPAVAIAFVAGGIPMALMVLVLLIILQQLENYIWQPLIINRVTGLPSLVIIIALVIGAQLAGLVGLILAVPVAVVVIEVINDRERIRHPAISPDNAQ